MPQPKVKLTVAFPADLHEATTALAQSHRRSFTAEVCVALDEHLAASTPSAPVTIPTTNAKE